MSAKEDQILNVPEQVLLDMGGLREAENELRDRLSRDPSDLELADHTGLSRKRIGYLRLMKPSFAEGKLMEVDEEGSGMSDPSVRQISNNEGLRAWHEFVYHDLDPIDQQIMEHTLGLHNKRVLSNQEVAKKLKLSPGAISQRKARIQSKLDMSADTGLSI
jgi:DNA-directed RNA polymerase specialized sigma subunit